MSTIEKEDALLRDHPESLDGPVTADEDDQIKVNAYDLATWIREVRALRKQVTELQARGTEMAMERQRWRDPVRMSAIAGKHLDRVAAVGCGGVMTDAQCIAAMRELVDAEATQDRSWLIPTIDAFVQDNKCDTSDGFTNRESLRISMYKLFGLDASALPR